LAERPYATLINDEKMSKSLGNFFTVREILESYRAEEVRYFILISQYRSPLNYDEEHLQNARAALTRFYTTLRDLPEASELAESGYETRFDAAMDDDFNTPEALAVLFELARETNRLKESGAEEAAALGATLKKLATRIGDWVQCEFFIDFILRWGESGSLNSCFVA